MAILSKEEAKKILEKVISFSKADGCEVNLNGADNGNIRYARNSVSTSGEDSNVSLAVQSYFGKKAGSATINEFDDASLEKVVRRAEELARLARGHNEANIICIPARFVDTAVAKEMVEVFMTTPFEGGRHETRVRKIACL